MDIDLAHAAPTLDYLGLDAELPEEVRALRDRIRAFGTQEILPVINEAWERAEFPESLLPGLRNLGIAGTVIQGYGCPGLTRLESGIVARELSRADGSVNTFMGVHSGLGMASINVLGSAEQRERWLPAMARMDRLGAFALTEPDHGSDSVSLETRARREGDHWILDGHKRWIGNGHVADLVTVFARDEADGRVKAFVVEKGEDGAYPEGYRPTVIVGKFGKRAINQADIVIEGLRIPEDHRLTGCEGFSDINKVLSLSRGGTSWEALGHAMAAYELAVSYAAERVQFSVPISRFQLVQEKLAVMLGEVMAIQMTCHRMAELQMRGKFTAGQASLVKLTSCRRALAVCRTARDIMAGNGMLIEHHVGRHLTDMEVVSTYEGTDSMQALIVGRDITGHSAFTAGGR